MDSTRESSLKWTMAFKPGMMINEAPKLYSAVPKITYAAEIWFRSKNRPILTEGTEV